MDRRHALAAGQDLPERTQVAALFADIKVIYEQARAFCLVSGDLHQQAHCEVAIGQVLRKQGRFADAAVWLARAESGFLATDDLAGIGQALQNQGALAAQQGNRSAAQQLFERSLAVSLELGDMAKVAGLTSDPR